MKKFAFVSRHVPTDSQIKLAAEQSVELVHIGDRDAFSITDADVGLEFEGVVVVHPAAALRLFHDFPIGVFENANRAPEGEPPKFEAAAFHHLSYL